VWCDDASRNRTLFKSTPRAPLDANWLGVLIRWKTTT
jgi:hypothetical protein